MMFRYIKIKQINALPVSYYILITNMCCRFMAIQEKSSLRITRRSRFIMKTCLYNFDPLKPHFYVVKLGFAGVYIIFLISAPNIDCGYSLEPPHRGGSNEYP